MADPYFNNVVLLLQMSGAENGVLFLDESPSPRSVSAEGNAKTSSNKTLFGLNTGYFDGAGDFLSLTGVSLSGDFCIEANVNPANVNNAFIVFDSRNADATTTGFVFYVRSTGKLTFGTGNPFAATEGITTVSNDAWSHVALTRSGSTIRGFLNGVLEFTVTDAAVFSHTAWKIGHQWSASGVLSAGNIAQLRITNGVARHAAGFIPPTEPYFFYGTLAGNATKASGGAVDQVVIRAWATRQLAGMVIPDNNGDWTISLPSGDYDITYFATDCQPICHGPYSVMFA